MEGGKSSSSNVEDEDDDFVCNMPQKRQKVVKKNVGRPLKEDQMKSTKIMRELEMNYPMLSIRCSPHGLFKELYQLEGKQIDAVKELGFGHVLDMKIAVLPTRMAYWVVRNFDPVSCELCLVNGRRIQITEQDVHRILGFPNGGQLISKMNKSKMDKKGILYLYKEWTSLFDNIAPEDKILQKHVVDLMVKRKTGDIWFKRHFMILLMSCFMETTPTGYVFPSIFECLVNVDNVKEWNWCEYIIRTLVSNRISWDPAKNNPFLGPALFLTVFYVDMVKVFNQDVCRRFPIFNNWNYESLKQRQDDEIRAGGFGQGLPNYPSADKRIDNIPNLIVEEVLNEEVANEMISMSMEEVANERHNRVDCSELILSKTKIISEQMVELSNLIEDIPRIDLGKHSFQKLVENAHKMIGHIQRFEARQGNIVPTDSFEGRQENIIHTESFGAREENIVPIENFGAQPENIVPTESFETRPEIIVNAESPETQQENIILAESLEARQEPQSGGQLDAHEFWENNEVLKAIEKSETAALRKNQSIIMEYDVPSFSLGLSQMEFSEIDVAHANVVNDEVDGVNDVVSDANIQNEISGVTKVNVEQEIEDLSEGVTNKNNYIAGNGGSDAAPIEKSARVKLQLKKKPVSLGGTLSNSVKVRTKRVLKKSKTQCSPYLRRPVSGCRNLTKMEKQLGAYVFLTNGSHENYILIKNDMVELKRHDMLSMYKGSVLSTFVVDTWSHYLNDRESDKSDQSPYRFFATTSATALTVVDTRCVSIENRRIIFSDQMNYILKSKEPNSLGNIHLFFFPIFKANLFYVICIDMRNGNTFVIDSLNDTEEECKLDKYNTILKRLRNVFADYLVDRNQEAKAKLIEDGNVRIVYVRWGDKKNKKDTAVYLMRHMETFMGEIKQWKGGSTLTSKRALNVLRVRYFATMIQWNKNNLKAEIEYMSEYYFNELYKNDITVEKKLVE